MPPFAVNKKAAFICSRWWEKWTLRVLDNFWVVWYIKGSCFFNTAAHGGAIQASCYPMTSKTNCTTMVFKKCCITTRTKIKAVDSLESTAFIILSTHFYSFFANQLSGNPLFTILQSHYKRYVMVTASIVPASGWYLSAIVVFGSFYHLLCY